MKNVITRAIPKFEFITLVEEFCGDQVTAVEVDRIMADFGDRVIGDRVIKHNDNRDKHYERA